MEIAGATAGDAFWVLGPVGVFGIKSAARGEATNGGVPKFALIWSTAWKLLTLVAIGYTAANWNDGRVLVSWTGSVGTAWRFSCSTAAPISRMGHPAPAPAGRPSYGRCAKRSSSSPSPATSRRSCSLTRVSFVAYSNGSPGAFTPITRIPYFS